MIPGLAIFNSVKIAALRDKSQLDKLSLKEYDDIDVVFYEYPWTDHQLSMGVVDFKNFLKIGLQVKNNGGIKVCCGMRMMSVQYKGCESRNDWGPYLKVVENKLLKWDEGYDVPNGKIEIYPNGGVGLILFAESNPYNMEYWFWFIDGRSRNHQVLEGEYKARLQLEGDCEKNGIKTALEPIEFEVSFTYRMRKLLDVSVLKLPRNDA